jgi:hypothetical protein
VRLFVAETIWGTLTQTSSNACRLWFSALTGHAHDQILSELPLAWMAEVKSVGPICMCSNGSRAYIHLKH